MPIPSPFHERTAPLCTSYAWKNWSGYCAVSAYTHAVEREYFAFRQSAGLLDITPLYKYDLRGPGAGPLLSWMTIKDAAQLKVGKVTYCCWCTEAGKVIDDGTIARLDGDHYRLTAAEPSLHWLDRLGARFDVRIEDTTQTVAALALQGPTSRDILRRVCDADMDGLKYFRIVKARLEDAEVWISRTGYTGDLGYEIWMNNADAIRVWDALIHAGRDHGIEPAGLDALDIARIEAGFIMLDVDYFSALKVVHARRMSTPHEIGLGAMIDLERGPFVGRRAIREEVARGPEWSLVGLEVPWEELEVLYDEYQRAPSLPARASRMALPIYDRNRQVGQVTSHTWSPILKKYIALASLRPPYALPGTPLRLEHTVEYERRTVKAIVRDRPFFNPKRKRTP